MDEISLFAIIVCTIVIITVCLHCLPLICFYYFVFQVLTATNDLMIQHYHSNLQCSP